MKNLYLVFLGCTVSLFMIAQSPPVPGNWELTFEDNFELDHVDPSKWRQGQAVSHINGAASNDGNNILVSDGTLKLIAKKDSSVFSGKKYAYSSGELTSYELFREVYGYFETRVKYDAVQGSWPAVWLMPDRGIRGNKDLKRQAFIKFNAEMISEPVTSAILHVKVKSLSSDNCGFTIHSLLYDSWSEKTLNWNNKPACDPVWIKEFTGTTDQNKVDQIDPQEFLTIDVTEEINEAILQGIDPGFVLKDYFMRHAEIQVYSKETTNEDDKPYLDIDGVKVFPSDDAYVRAGQYEETNYGSDSILSTMDPWASSTSTYDGGMEMDILETLGIWGDNYNQHAVHWDGYGDEHKSEGSGKIKLTPSDDGFHTYGLLWMPGKVEFYTDGEKTWEYTNDRIGSVSVFILLSHQLGGWHGNGEILDEKLPATMTIDYVRVYKNTHGASVMIETPEENAVFPPDSNIIVDASVTEWGGNVSSMNFFYNNTLLAVDTVPPYCANMNTLSRGKYSILAQALAADESVMDSDTIQIIVGNPPEIAIDSPENNADFDVPLNLTLSANASSNGTIQQVDFFLNDAFFFSKNSAPYSFEWHDVPLGKYRLTAKAVDELGLENESDEVVFTVDGQNIPDPWAMKDIGNPAMEGYGTHYQGVFLVEGAGSDTSSIYSDNLTFVYQVLTGKGEIIARIKDIEADNPDAYAGLMIREHLSPGSKTAGVFISKDEGAHIYIRKNTDASGSKTRFNSMLSAPVWFKLTRNEFSCKGYVSFDKTTWYQIPGMDVPITMKDSVLIGMAATSETSNERSASMIDSVTLNGITFQDELPQISLVAALQDTFHAGDLLIEVQVYDPDGGQIKKVEFFANGSSIGSATSDPYSFLWEDLPDGKHTLTASCLDDEGNISVSSPIEITANFVSSSQKTISTPELRVNTNSSTNNILISIDGLSDIDDGRIELFDLQGRRVYLKETNQVTNILPTDHLKSGIYVVRFTVGLESLMKRIFID